MKALLVGDDVAHTEDDSHRFSSGLMPRTNLGRWKVGVMSPRRPFIGTGAHRCIARGPRRGGAPSRGRAEPRGDGAQGREVNVVPWQSFRPTRTALPSGGSAGR